MTKLSAEREGAAAGGSSQRRSKRAKVVPDGDENRLRSEDRLDEQNNDSVEADVSATACENHDSASFVLTDPEVLDCSICYETLKIPVFQCVNGHIACSTCCTRVKKKCPSCSCLIGDNRCLAIEKVIESVKASCMFSEYGCKKKLSLVGKKDHEKNCRSRPFKCFFDSCCIKISASQFTEHCVDIHQASVEIIQCNCLIPISLDKYCKTIILAEGTVNALFFLNNDIVSDGNMIRARLVFPVLLRRELSYELTARQDANTLRLQSSMELHTKRAAKSSPFLLVPHGFFNPGSLLKMELCINLSKHS